MRALLVVALVWPILPVTVHANFQDGNTLLTLCEAEPISQRSMCLAYISGVIDGHLSVSDSLYCAPGNVTAGQLMGIVVEYLRGNPDQRRYSAASTIGTALTQAFPC